MYQTKAKMTTARKSHHCDLCQQPIEKGSAYLCWTTFDEGDVYSHRVHEHCQHFLEKHVLTESCDLDCSSNCSDCLAEHIWDSICGECEYKNTPICEYGHPTKCARVQKIIREDI